jgi:hypothetical protein
MWTHGSTAIEKDLLHFSHNSRIDPDSLDKAHVFAFLITSWATPPCGLDSSVVPTLPVGCDRSGHKREQPCFYFETERNRIDTVARFAYFGPSLEFINRLLPEKARAPTADTVQVVFNSPKGDPHMADTESSAPSNFIKTIIEEDLEKNTHGGAVATRFPPEPNGYLHIGHAKSICLNFGLARQYGGTCNLRFDDTNPTKEEVEYVDAIKADVHWLGFDWQDREFYASDYFEQLYGFAVRLIKDGKAYVDSLSADDIREYRGTFTEPGKESPYRDRSVDENLDLFERMRAGEFDDGAHVLRAKIDMAHPNLLMRDPTLYRIRNTRHHRTGDAWCIYPMYDFTHCLSDASGVHHPLHLHPGISGQPRPVRLGPGSAGAALPPPPV